jgi:DNA replication initiation complex subunit (GINS family)
MMADLTVEDLADIYRRELVSSDLLELPDGFYREVAGLISRLSEAKRGDELQRELLEEELKHIAFMVNEIHAARVLKAIDRVASGEAPAPVLERERTAFLEIRQSLEKLRSELVIPALSGKTAVRVPTERTKALVMMLVNLNDRILGTDQKYYGPFKKGEVVNLPEANAEFMVKHEYARRIKVRE